jgi:hypothetical protein
MALAETPRAFWSFKRHQTVLGSLFLSHTNSGTRLRQSLLILAQANRPKVLLTCGIGLRLVLLVRHDSKARRVHIVTGRLSSTRTAVDHTIKRWERRREEKTR